MRASQQVRQREKEKEIWLLDACISGFTDMCNSETKV